MLRGKKALSYKSLICYRGEWRGRRWGKQHQRMLHKANRRLARRLCRGEHSGGRRFRGKR